MKYPIIKGKHLIFRKGGDCTYCRKKKNGNFVTLNGGGSGIGSMGNSFLTINEIGIAKVTKSLKICDNEGFCQFEFYFCSTKCLRSFLNKMVDDFEKL